MRGWLKGLTAVLLVAAAGCSEPDDWGGLEYWNDGFACDVVVPHDYSGGSGIDWVSHRENALVYESGPPEQGTTFGSELRCEFSGSANRNDFVEVHAMFESDAERVSTAVDKLFDSVVFATEEEYAGLDEVSGFDGTWDRIGEWERVDVVDEHLSFSQFQYAFEDANMYVRVKVQLQDREVDTALRDSTFELALAAAETIREGSVYDFG